MGACAHGMQSARHLRTLRLDFREGDEDASADGVSAEVGSSGSDPLTARAEFAGAFLLYFACIPPEPQVCRFSECPACLKVACFLMVQPSRSCMQPCGTCLPCSGHPSHHCLSVLQSMDIACVLRQLPPALQQCTEASFALGVHQAVRCCDALSFLSLHSHASWMQRALMEPRLQQVLCLPRACDQLGLLALFRVGSLKSCPRNLLVHMHVHITQHHALGADAAAGNGGSGLRLSQHQHCSCRAAAAHGGSGRAEASDGGAAGECAWQLCNLCTRAVSPADC